MGCLDEGPRVTGLCVNGCDVEGCVDVGADAPGFGVAGCAYLGFANGRKNAAGHV